MRELIVYFLRLASWVSAAPWRWLGKWRRIVGERKWLTRERMREAVAVCQSLPGPLAIQVGIFIAYLQGGFWGRGLVAGPSSFRTS
jgi:chromate transporter